MPKFTIATPQERNDIMATAKKLPSGSWRCLVYDYTDETGKRHYKSFTSDNPSTKGKREAEFKVAQYAADKQIAKHSTQHMTFAAAFEKYIASKTNILSPATIRGYKQMEKYYLNIKEKDIFSLTGEDIQIWVNEFASSHSPKTTKNAHGLITAILNTYRPDFILRTSLPQKTISQMYVPSDADVKQLVEYFMNKDKDMSIAVCLAAYGTLRRSEICALKAYDVNFQNHIIHVHSALVMDERKKFVEKTTKTLSSDRYIEMPAFVIEMLPKEGKIVNLTPDNITSRFGRAIAHLEMHHFRFHDLRRYAASVMHAIGVPDVYIMERGGWHSDAVLKKIYRGSMEDYKKKFAEMTNSHFETMQHEMQHKNQKA